MCQNLLSFSIFKMVFARLVNRKPRGPMVSFFPFIKDFVRGILKYYVSDPKMNKLERMYVFDSCSSK